MQAWPRTANIKWRELFAENVIRVATADGLAVPIDFFNIQVGVRTYTGDELRQFCYELGNWVSCVRSLQKWSEASALVVVVFPERVLVYDELDEVEAQMLMDELMEARKHLFQAFLTLEKLAVPA